MRGVHDDHAAGGGGFEIDVVDADAGAADNLEVGGGVEEFLGYLGVGADGEAVVLADDLAELGRG